jgi:hypothetical protein
MADEHAHTAADEHARTAEDVQLEIAQTRADLDDTLDVIGRRLSPREIKSRAVAYAKDAAAHLPDAVQRHPAGVALAAGAIVAAVLVQRLRARRADERADQARAAWARLILATAANADQHGRSGARLSEAIDKVGELAHGARDSVAHVLGDVTAGAQRLFDSDAARPIVDPAKRMLAVVEDASRDRPLVTLGVTLLAGALLARLLRD